MMNFATTVAVSLFFILAPAALIFLCEHNRWAKRIGAVGLCYLTGLILGNTLLSGGILIDTSAIGASIKSAQQVLSDFSIAFALPMLLMTLKITQWRQQAGKALLSMLLATTAVVSVATTLFLVWQSQPETSIDTSHMVAMSVGVYTGGTPNLAAIKAGLDIPNADYLVFHSLDTVIGAGYLVFMLSVAIPLVRRYFPRNDHIDSRLKPDAADADTLEQYGDDYRPLVALQNLRQLGVIAALSLGCLAIALGLSQWMMNAWQLQNTTAVTIVLLTLSGGALSMINSVQRLELAYRFGMYWIYVFCLVVASMASFDDLLNVDPTIVLYILAVVVFSLLLHALFCKLTKIDGDTFMITSVAAICSPPFVPIMARALNNSSLILSGMTTGIIGYALGNFLGISLALALQSLP